MNDDMQVTVTLTAEDLAFYDQAKAAGIPSILVSMYSSALKRLVASAVEAEREACAQLCLQEFDTGLLMAPVHPRLAAAIRARGEK